MQVKERPILYSAPMVRAINDKRKTMTRRIINFDRLRVIPRFDVEADFNFLNPTPIKVTAGRKYPCTMNQNGAVCAVLPNGDKLGLKPGEFDFSCPYTDGETVMVTENGEQGWRILPRGTNRLWVRETWANYQTVDYVRYPDGRSSYEYSDGLAAYRADGYTSIQDLKETIKIHAGHACEAVEVKHNRWLPSIHMPRWASRILLEVVEVRVERLQDITEADARAEGVITNDAVKASSYVYWFEKLWDDINGPGAWAKNPWVWVVVFKVVENNSIQEKII